MAGWVCESTALPLVKWFSTTDQSRELPVPITCVRLEKPVGAGWRSWADWFKVLRQLELLP